ncbi:MAG: glycosyltransferase 87 family protein [Polyangia bacterium]|jgi:alpha-1,2-mannosyltransferase|nr:glycosyltransferase 87 family protein [Polyangia bacterium]
MPRSLPPERLERYVAWFLVSLLVLFGVINTLRVDGKLRNRRAAADFEVYQTAAREASMGGNVYDGLEKKHGLPYHYPPFLASVLRPTTSMTVPGGALLWNLLQVAALPLIFIFLAALLRSAQLPRPDLLAAASLAGCAWFFMDNILWSQVNTFVLLAVTGGLALLFRGQALGAGALLAVGFSIKFTPVIFLLLLPWFRLRGAVLFLSGFAAGVIACCLLVPAIAYGPGAALDMAVAYSGVLSDTLFGGKAVLPCWDNCANHSLLFALQAWFGKCGTLLAPLEPETILAIFTALRITMIAGLLASALKVALRRIDRDSYLLAAQIALGIVLLSPVAWIHHWVILTIPLALVAGMALAAPRDLPLALAAALLAATVLTGYQLELVHAGLISVFLFASWAALAALTLIPGGRKTQSRGASSPVEPTEAPDQAPEAER